ncbi:MAG: hypothetical protein QF578_20260 [Alphaproteobacteria bacterium]|jgi:hypothetical protein|nr:hypothetical protein [Alphaproteobacteria bacterium]MDP6815827.1 hypothetical protein [Alphaproteobacteria bacterium]
MRKALILGIVGAFVSGSALAGGGCFYDTKSASGSQQQTVATDHSSTTQTPAQTTEQTPVPSTVKTGTKG